MRCAEEQRQPRRICLLTLEGGNQEEGDARLPVVQFLLSDPVPKAGNLRSIERQARLHLRSSSHPPPESARTWSRSTVHDILSNPAYFGRTYAFRETRFRAEPDNRRRGKQAKNIYIYIKRPREDWIEVPNATPAIISESLFEAAQGRLQRNRELASRNTGGSTCSGGS